jgi:dephospho-CoA kinase
MSFCYDEDMKKSILITAVAGSGKSTVCKALSSLGYEAYDIESIPGLFSLIDSRTDEPILGKNLGDLKEGLDADWVCNTEKLKVLIAKQKSDVAFYCGGTSRTEELMAQFDSTVILQVSDETTRKRLSTRLQGEFGDSEDTREWVLSWKHKIEADWLAAGGVSVSAEADPESVARDIVGLYIE